jgi:hypothetical protein
LLDRHLSFAAGLTGGKHAKSKLHLDGEHLHPLLCPQMYTLSLDFEEMLSDSWCLQVCILMPRYQRTGSELECQVIEGTMETVFLGWLPEAVAPPLLIID